MVQSDPGSDSCGNELVDYVVVEGDTLTVDTLIGCAVGKDP